MAAPQLAGVVQLADEKRKLGVNPASGGGVGQLPTRSVAKWTPQAIDGALSAADSGNMMRAADLVETIMASDDRVSGVLSARTLGMLRLDLSFEGGSEEARTQLEANGRADWETMHPDAELSQLMAWGIVLGVGLGQRKPLDRELGSKQMHTLETWHPRWLYQNVYTEEWRVSHKGGTSDVVAGDGQWVMYMPYGAHRPWARASWRALAFAWILKQFSLHDRARFSEVYGGPIRVGIAAAGANERMRTRWLAALKNLGRDSTLVLPPGYDLKLVEVGAGKGIDVFDQQIEWADRAIAVVLAGQIVTTEGTPGFNKGSIHETIKADTIGFTAKSTSLCLYEQSLKPSAGLWYGDINAAPKPQWDTTLPEDQKAKVDAMQGAGLAIKTLDEVLASSGVRVNALALTDRFGIPTVALPAQSAKAPNVQLAPTDVAKVVRVNEARAAAQLGPLTLPGGSPDPDGDLTVAQFDLKKAAEIQKALAPQPTAGSPALPPPQPPGSPSPFSARLAGFDESQHPRADDGEFGSGGGSDSDSGGPSGSGSSDRLEKEKERLETAENEKSAREVDLQEAQAAVEKHGAEAVIAEHTSKMKGALQRYQKDPVGNDPKDIDTALARFDDPKIKAALGKMVEHEAAGKFEKAADVAYKVDEAMARDLPFRPTNLFHAYDEGKAQDAHESVAKHTKAVSDWQRRIEHRKKEVVRAQKKVDADNDGRTGDAEEKDDKE